MKKPWEETWRADDEIGDVFREDGTRILRVRTKAPGFPNADAKESVDYDNECARLFAAAPEMTRLMSEFVEVDETRVMTPEERGRFAERMDALLQRIGAR